MFDLLQQIKLKTLPIRLTMNKKMRVGTYFDISSMKGEKLKLNFIEDSYLQQILQLGKLNDLSEKAKEYRENTDNSENVQFSHLT